MTNYYTEWTKCSVSNARYVTGGKLFVPQDCSSSSLAWEGSQKGGSGVYEHIRRAIMMS